MLDVPNNEVLHRSTCPSCGKLWISFSPSFSGDSLYKQAIVCGNLVAVGDSVLVGTADSEQLPPIYYIEDQETFRGGRNVGLKAYAVCQFLEIEVPKEQGSAKSTEVKYKEISDMRTDHQKKHTALTFEK
ncbi:hypothetical protein Ddye_000384 [Dipteronia dyeriana]|uniref:Uncharacterized protein n=1 Tax=Dipteronia dyeriana TaxID=168575 RepID=A0AAE0CSB2_9ROSI|nr:hypothetical protein Ddye_000384 [Dipteronia dyeriana]